MLLFRLLLLGTMCASAIRFASATTVCFLVHRPHLIVTMRAIASLYQSWRRCLQTAVTLGNVQLFCLFSSSSRTIWTAK